MQADVLISEVGPRDGLQNCQSVMPTAGKLRWIRVLAGAGLAEIEVGSFVPAKLLPQLADTADVVAGCHKVGGFDVAVLAPNLRGSEDALAAGVDKITVPFSVSETHSLRNVRRTHVQMFEEIRRIRAAIDEQPKDRRPHLEGSLSTAFGCTLEGAIDADLVFRSADALLAAGCDEVGLSDTTGYGNPAQVTRLVTGLHRTVGADKASGIHLHNTRGLGLANALAAYEAGIRTFDSSMGGLGGCPFAPGASGNIVTEDLAFLFESMGVATGLDLDALIAAREVLHTELPGEPLFGFTAEAGLPLGFTPATPGPARQRKTGA